MRLLNEETAVEAQKETPVSSAWYFIAILGAFLGGVIGYLVVRDENRRVANRLLWIGIASTFLVWPVVFLAGDLYISSYQILPQPQSIQQTNKNPTPTRTQAVSLANGTIVGPPAPVGVAVDSLGTVYWANYDTGQLLTMQKGASSASILLRGLNHPSGIAIDSSGNVYYSEQLAGTVSELPAGSSTPRLLFNSTDVGFISVDRSGNIYFIPNSGCNGQGFTNSIMEYVRSSGQILTVLSPIGSVGNNPTYGQVFVDSAGLYFTTCSGNVEVLPAGSSSPQILVTGLQAGSSVSSDGITADSHGNVFYTQYWVGVFMLRAGTSSPVTISTLGGTHYGLALDGQGDVYYTDNLGGTIWKIPVAQK
jgi:hypothetical protein